MTRVQSGRHFTGIGIVPTTHDEAVTSGSLNDAGDRAEVGSDRVRRVVDDMPLGDLEP
jgi:hypothetical protein